MIALISENDFSEILYMFCDTNLNLSNFNTQKVTDMNYMFNNCCSLTNLNLSNFNTQNVSYMRDMFSGCNSLKKENIITKDKLKNYLIL